MSNCPVCNERVDGVEVETRPIAGRDFFMGNLSRGFPLEAVRRKQGLRSGGRNRKFAAAFILVGMLSALFEPDARGQTLQWDPNLGIVGAQGGTGDWDGGNFWWNGSVNLPWTSGSEATFGGTAGTVDGSGISVNDMIFNTAGYILAPGGTDAGLTLVRTNSVPIIFAAGNTTINHQLHGTFGFSKEGTGRLQIGAANHTLIGPITVNAGELEIADGLDDLGVSFHVVGKLTTTDPDLTAGRLTGTLGGVVALGGNLTVGGANQNDTFAGNLTGTGNFSKAGSGTMTLTGTNTFSGAIVINGGTLSVNSSATATGIPDMTSVTVGTGAVFRVQSEVIGSLAGSGNVELISLLETGGNGDSTIYSGVITNGAGPDANRIIKRGAGTFTLTGLSTFGSAVLGDSDVSISEGAISVADVANQGLSSPLGGGDRLAFGGGGNGRLIFTGAGFDSTDWRIALFGRGTVEVSAATGQLNLDGVISGVGAFETTGPGKVGLSNSTSSFTGDFAARDGTVVVADVANSGSNSPLGAGNVIALGGGVSGNARLIFAGSNGQDSSNRPIALGAGSVIEVTNPAAPLNLTGSISGSGDLTKAGPGSLFPTNTANSFAGNVIVADGTLISLALANAGVASTLGAGNRITIGGFTTVGELTLSGAANSTTDREIHMASSAGAGGGGTIRSNAAAGTTVTLNGPITGSSFLTFDGNTNDTFVLNGANTHFGAVLIKGVKVQVIGGSGLPSNGFLELVDDTAASLQIDIADTIGTFRGGAGATPGRITLNAALTVNDNSSGSTYAGVIEGPGSIHKIGNGFINLTNPASSFTGGITIGRGSIFVSTGAVMGSNSPLGSNGTIGFGTDTTNGRLVVTGGGSHIIDRPILMNAGNGTIETEGNATQVFLDGAITGPGSLTKSGLGELVLRSGNKNFTGITFVGQGLLTLEGSLTGSGLAISGGGAFNTNGSVATTTGMLLVSGGVAGIAKASTGTLNTGPLQFNLGELHLDLNGIAAGQFDAFNVSGSVFLSGPVQLFLGFSFDPLDHSDVFRIIQNDGNDATVISGTNARFAFGGNVLEEGERFFATSGAVTQLFEIRYGLDAGDNDVRLLAVPEPGSGLLGLLGLGLFGLRGQRGNVRHFRE
jgi:fibronectin-binding autotransporter adhesin